MEEVIVPSRKQSSSALLWAVGGAGAGLIVAIVVAVLYFGVWTVDVKLDGRPLRLKAGTTVATLFARNLIERKPGNLVSAKKHRVLDVGGGGQPFVSAGGQPLSPNARLANAESLMSSNGADVVEPTRVTTEPIPVATRYVGVGPITSVAQTGTPGVRQVTIGTISKEVVRKKELVAEVDRVVSRQGAAEEGAKVVALTFDDGPWTGSTKAILKILQQNGIKATFFEIGSQARHQPALSRAVADAGMELGNHSETHPTPFDKLSKKAATYQIKNAENDITKASGQTPRFFRPPGGAVNQAMFPILSELNMGWVEWSVDTNDWKRPGSGAIINTVVRHVTPGAVILMHDGGGDRSQTVKALPTIIKDLKAAGYSFATISELRSVPHVMG